MSKMCAITLSLLIFLSACGKDDGKDSPKPPPKGNEDTLIDEKNLPVNSSDQLDKPTIILISIPGFRSDFLNKFKPKNLSEIAQAGVKAASLRPAYPSQIAPNQMSIVTGMLPVHHGIVANHFWDENRQNEFRFDLDDSRKNPNWYLSRPIWVLAEEQGLRTAAINWLGAESTIEKIKPSYGILENRDISCARKVTYLKKWLTLPKQNRPHLHLVSFDEVNQSAKVFGINSAEVRNAIRDIDSAVGDLRHTIANLDYGVNLIVLSESGMKLIDNNKVVQLGSIADLSGFVVSSQGALTMLYSNNPKTVTRALMQLKNDSRFTALRRDKVPSALQFSKSERIGEIVVISTAPNFITVKSSINAPENRILAEQGWDPRDLDMHGIFLAEGPQFKSRFLLPSINTIDLFPLLLQLLSLQTLVQVDGNSDMLGLAIKN